MKTIKPKRKRLSRLVVDEVSLCDKGANPYSKICLAKRDFQCLIDAAGERHKARIEKALRDATGRRQFDERLTKSRAKFDGDVAAILRGLAAPTADAGHNPPPLTTEPGLMEREATATARARSGRPAYVEPTPDSAIVGRGDGGTSAKVSPLEEQMSRMQARAGAMFPDQDPAVAFEKYLGTAEGRQMHADYRNAHLRSVLKSYSPYPSRPTRSDDADVAANDEEDGLDPDEAMEECEKRVSELVARGVSPAAAWDEVSVSPIFKSAKRLVVGKVAM